MMKDDFNENLYQPGTFLGNACNHAENLIIDWSKNKEGDLSRMEISTEVLEKAMGSLLAVSAYLKVTHENSSSLTYRQEVDKAASIACDIVDSSINKIIPEYIAQPNHSTTPEVA